MDTVSKVAKWIIRNTPLLPQIDFIDVDIPLKWKPFTHIQGKNYMGLDGIKEQIEQRSDIVYGYYQAIIFLYDTTSYRVPDNGVLACWTYPNSFFGAPFIEVFYDTALQGYSLYYFFCHELLHAMHRRLWSQGIWTVDDMDNYDGYAEPDSLNNSYTRNLARLAPFWKKVAEEASWLTLTRMKQMLAILIGKTR